MFNNDKTKIKFKFIVFSVISKLLPISGIVTGGTSEKGGTASYFLGSLQSAPRPFGFPRNCHEARVHHGLRQSGEILIQPSQNVHPFLIYCDLHTKPGIGDNFTNIASYKSD